MKLELYEEDLLPEHKMLNASQVQFKHFTEKAQAAIREVGKGTYYTSRRTNYNVVYPPDSAS